MNGSSQPPKTFQVLRKKDANHDKSHSQLPLKRKKDLQIGSLFFEEPSVFFVAGAGLEPTTFGL